MIREDMALRDEEIRKWGRGQVGPLRAEMRGLGIQKYSGQLQAGLRDRYYRFNDKINGIGYVMPRHGVFVHKGVGRGYPIEAVGGRALGQSNSRRVRALQNRGFNNKAIARFLKPSDKLGAKQRRPKPWFNPVMDRSLPGLADIVARSNADVLSNNVFIV